LGLIEEILKGEGSSFWGRKAKLVASCSKLTVRNDRVIGHTASDVPLLHT
jgi:hypothetical protein